MINGEELSSSLSLHKSFSVCRQLGEKTVIAWLMLLFNIFWPCIILFLRGHVSCHVCYLYDDDYDDDDGDGDVLCTFISNSTIQDLVYQFAGECEWCLEYSSNCVRSMIASFSWLAVRSMHIVDVVCHEDYFAPSHLFHCPHPPAMSTRLVSSMWNNSCLPRRSHASCLSCLRTGTWNSMPQILHVVVSIGRRSTGARRACVKPDRPVGCTLA